LYEISSYKDALHLLDFAEEECEDKTTRIYSNLLNTRASIYLDNNDLIGCRILRGKVAQLQKVTFDAEDSIDRELLARQLHNSGNLECAEGNWNTAIENYTSSSAVKDTILQFSVLSYTRTQLCLGRAYYFKGEWESARVHYERSAKHFEQDPRLSPIWIAQ